MRKAGLIATMVALSTVLGASVTSAQNASGFDGFYVGAHGGYAEVEDSELDGGLGGIHGGYNYVTGTMLIGIEGDYSWSDVSYETTENFGIDVNVAGSLNYFASIRARLGWLYGPSTLFFATAGYSWSEIEVKASALGDEESLSVDLSGAVLGGGVEYKFSRSLSARLEGLHYWGGNEDELGDDEGQTNVIRAGLSYYFK